MRQLLNDFISLEEAAKEIHRHPRTLQRWMKQPDGLPFTRMGKSRLLHVPTWQAWLMSRMRTPNPES